MNDYSLGQKLIGLAFVAFLIFMMLQSVHEHARF